MSRDMDQRIQKMFRGDALFAWGFVACSWAVVLFVFFKISPLISGGSVQIVLIIGGALVLLFNTIAIFAMIRHYAHEKRFIYGIDIRHLDQMRRMKGE